MREVKIIFNKEMRRVFKDRKMIFSLFVLPVVLMVGIYGLIGYLGSRSRQDIEEHRSVVYIQNAPADLEGAIASFAEEAEISYLGAGDDTEGIKQQIYDGTADLLVVFPEDFARSVERYGGGGEPPQVKTFYNPTENYSEHARENMVNALTSEYEKKLLAERFGDISVITAFTIDSDNPDAVIQDEHKAGGMFLASMLPYLVTILLFAGTMSLGTDTITGEKERGTMASMLVTPVSRTAIVVGKLISLVVLSILSASVYVLAMGISLPAAVAGGDSGLSISISPAQIAMIAVVILSLAFLYVTLVGVVAVMARTVKEATSYTMPVYMLVIVAGIFTMMEPGSERAVYEYLIPIYNCSVALGEIFTGELTALHFILTFGTTLLAGGVLTAWIVKAFGSERVMFNA